MSSASGTSHVWRGWLRDLSSAAEHVAGAQGGGLPSSWRLGTLRCHYGLPSAAGWVLSGTTVAFRPPQVPDGLVLFFGSYAYERTVHDAWESSGVLSKLRARKLFLREPQR